jgi:hypothetical protein
MAMLPLTSKSVPQISRRVNLLLLAVAGCAVAVPTLYVSRTPTAEAEEPVAAARQAVPSTPVTQPTSGSAAVPAVTYITVTEPAKAAPPAVEFLPRLTASEKKIVAALEQSTDLEFDNQPLSDVMDYIKAKHEIEIQIDTKGLTDAAMDTQAPVTRNVKGISLRSALRLMLDEFDLTYTLADEVLLITSKERADETTLIRTYPVDDFLGSASGGEGEKFLEIITTTVDPDSWKPAGGPGTISVSPAAKSLVISQPYARHEKVLELLRALRAARLGDDKQGAASDTKATPRAVETPAVPKQTRR